MMKNSFSKIFCLCLLISGCAPLHIREHEATNISQTGGQIYAKTAIGAGLYYSIQSENIRGNLSVLNQEGNSDLLNLTINLIGKKGAVARVNQKIVKYRYNKKDWNSVEGKINSEQWRWEYGVSNGGKKFEVFQPQFSKDYIFSMEDKKGNEEHLIFSVVIPKKEEDLEIEIPEIFLDGKLLSPKILIFKWSDRWTLSPINS